VRQQGTRRYHEHVVPEGATVFVVGDAEQDRDASRPLHPEDLTVRPDAGGPFVLSEFDEAAATAHVRNRMLLVPAALVTALVGVAMVVVPGVLPVTEGPVVSLLGLLAVGVVASRLRGG
jgi:hypothetical protein